MTLTFETPPAVESAALPAPGLQGPRQYLPRLAAAQMVRTERENIWRLCKAMYQLQYGTLARRKRWGDQIIANNPVSKAILDTIYSASTLRMPEMSITDAGKLSEAAAAVANYWYRRWRFHRQVRLSSRDAMMLGTGWLKAGWVHQQRPGRPDPNQAAVLAQGAYSAAVAMSQRDPAYVMPSIEGLGSQAARWLAERTPPEVLQSHPRWDRVSPWDMWVDPEAVSLDSARWVCQRVWESLPAVRANENYDPAARAVAAPTHMRVTDEAAHYGGGASRYGYIGGYAYQGVASDQIGRVAVMEMWDLEEGLVAKWATDSAVFLSVRPQPYACPFEHMTMYELPDEFYGMGELEPLIGLQDELNEMLTIDLGHRRQQLSKFIAWDQVADDPRVQAKMKSAEVGAVVPVPRPSDGSPATLSEQIAQLDRPHTSQQVERSELRAQDNMFTISAVNELHDAGRSLKTHQTATAIAAREDAMNMRTSEKNTIFESAVVNLMRMTLQQAQMMLAKPVRARSAVRAGGNPIVVDRAMLASVDVWDLRVEVGTMTPSDSASQRQNWLLATQILTGSPAAAAVNWQAWMVNLLSRLGVEDPEMFLAAPGQMPPGAPPELGGGPALPSGAAPPAPAPGAPPQ